MATIWHSRGSDRRLANHVCRLFKRDSRICFGTPNQRRRIIGYRERKSTAEQGEVICKYFDELERGRVLSLSQGPSRGRLAGISDAQRADDLTSDVKVNASARHAGRRLKCFKQNNAIAGQLAKGTTEGPINGRAHERGKRRSVLRFNRLTIAFHQPNVVPCERRHSTAIAKEFAKFEQGEAYPPGGEVERSS